MDYSPAASGNLGAYVPFQLLAGETEVVTQRDTFLTGHAMAAYTVVGRITASGKLIPVVTAASDGSQVPVGILAVPLDTSSAGLNADAIGPYYVGGAFNHEALVWPTGVTTLAARKALFDRTGIVIGDVQGALAFNQT